MPRILLFLNSPHGCIPCIDCSTVSWHTQNNLRAVSGIWKHLKFPPVILNPQCIAAQPESTAAVHAVGSTEFTLLLANHTSGDVSPFSIAKLSLAEILWLNTHKRLYLIQIYSGTVWHYPLKFIHPYLYNIYYMHLNQIVVGILFQEILSQLNDSPWSSNNALGIWDCSVSSHTIHLWLT